MNGLIKSAGVCLLGICVSLIALGFFTWINTTLTDASDFATGSYRESVRNGSVEDPFVRVSSMVWKFDWIYNPAVAILTGLFVGLVDRTRRRTRLAAASMVPFLILIAYGMSLSILNFFLAGFYLVLAIFASWAVAERKGGPQ